MNDKIAVYATRVEENIKDEVYQMFLNLVSDEKRKKIQAYRFKKDSLRSLYGEILLRYALQKQYQISELVFALSYNEYGKPYLKKYPSVHYNISHSGEWVVCGVGKTEIGIDVEQIDFSYDNMVNLARRFFSQNEFNDLVKRDGEDRIGYFYDLWTLKESYVKYKGEGLSIPLKSFRFKIEDDKIYFETAVREDVFFKQYGIDSKYRLSVCTNQDMFCDEVVMVGLEDMVDLVEKSRR